MPQNYIFFSENKKPPLIFSKISRETCPKSSRMKKKEMLSLTILMISNLDSRDIPTIFARELFMKKRLTLLFAAVISLCMVSCDYVLTFYIENRTSDAVIIGISDYHCVDSVNRFLKHKGAWIPELLLKFNGGKKLNLTEEMIIHPDSSGVYAELNAPLFYTSPDSTGYFYIIKTKTAINHTWEEICRDSLYETLIVTKEKEKQSRKRGMGTVIEWQGDK